jgi:hypothetical protein
VARADRVAASGSRRDEDGQQLPAGEVHAWEPGRNETTCGLSLSRSGLVRFSHVGWGDVQPATGGAADHVQAVCPRCAAANGARRDDKPWRRTSPRP